MPLHSLNTCQVYVTLFLLLNVLVVCEGVISENYENTPITNAFLNTKLTAKLLLL